MLYKYIKKEHIDLFKKNGSLKIGTLYEYRNEEDLGSVIGDDKEGVHITELNSPQRREIDLADNTPESQYFRKLLPPDKQDVRPKIIMMPDANVATHTTAPNCYLYCVTSKYDEDLMAEFGCDKCIEIFNPEKYFQAISKVIRHRGDYLGYFDIVYGNKTTDYSNPHTIHPCLLKDEKYRNQSEVRAIWSPKKEPRGPLFAKAPKAREYCREFNP